MDGHGILKSALKYSDYFFLNYIQEIQNTPQNSIYIFSLFNQRIEYKIDFGDEQFVSTKTDKFGVFFETRSLQTPRKVYRMEFNQFIYRQPNATTYSMIVPILWKESKIKNLDALQITVQYDSFDSSDGTKIPFTIIQKTNQNNDFKKPCLVYVSGPGGFGDGLLPKFNLDFVELFNGIAG